MTHQPGVYVPLRALFLVLLKTASGRLAEEKFGYETDRLSMIWFLTTQHSFELSLVT